MIAKVFLQDKYGQIVGNVTYLNIMLHQSTASFFLLSASMFAYGGHSAKSTESSFVTRSVTMLSLQVSNFIEMNE